MADGFVVIRGGVVQNEPRDPVLDMDVLDDHTVDDQTIDEVESLLARAREVHATGVVVACTRWLHEHDEKVKARVAAVRAPRHKDEW